MGLFVPLDVDYASDDKLIEAGPMAELLYVRGLAFCKRTMSDGHIRRSQLTAVGLGIPNAAKHAQRLVDVGAWTATSHGWRVAAWLKRNKSAAQIRSESDTKKANSALANHRRWHIGEGKEPSISCPHCYPKPDPKADPNPETPSDSTESESESETEVKPETEPEVEVEGSQSQSSSNPATTPTGLSTTLDDDDLFNRALEMIVQAKCRDRAEVQRPHAYAMTVRTNTIREDGELIRHMINDRLPTEQVAAFVLGYGFTAQAEQARGVPWCDTHCTCDGTGWVWVDDNLGGYEACPNRKAAI